MMLLLKQMMEEEDDDLQSLTDTSAEAAEERIKEQLTQATSKMVMLNIIESDSKMSVRKNSSKENFNLTDTSKENTRDEEKDTYEEISASIDDFLKKGNSASDLSKFMSYLSGTPGQQVAALFDSLFKGAGKGFSKEVSSKKLYLAKVVQSDDAQIDLLEALASFCKKASSDAMKEVAFFLKTLYDEGIVEEEYIVKWCNNYQDKSTSVWKNVKPFVEWLKSAESEPEDELMDALVMYGGLFLQFG